jgi:hypothetical protein
MADVYAVTGNYLEGTKTSRVTARVWLTNPNGHNVSEDVGVIAVSRSGRLIEKWERGRRLGTWRVCVLPDSHPMRRRWSILTFEDRGEAEKIVAQVTAATDRLRG